MKLFEVELVELLVVLLTLEVVFVEFKVLLEVDWESEIEFELEEELLEEPELEDPPELLEEPELLEDPPELEDETLWTDCELDPPPPVLVTSSGCGPSCPGWAPTKDIHKQIPITIVNNKIIFLLI